MTSTIVPPVDLAPGMPSRVVTISATDVTEGGQSLEGQMVRFALSDTLDVTSGGDVIAKTQAEVVLDANGEGRIRLPVYDDDVKTWCGKDWAILVTATWGSQKAIRVPAGTSNISLSALPPVRPLRGRELQWAVTGASVSVSEGASWDIDVSLSGGVLDFDFTVPPGGTAWARGRIIDPATLTDLDPGVYTVSSVQYAGMVDGLPEVHPGTLVIEGNIGQPVRSFMYFPHDRDYFYSMRTASGGTLTGWIKHEETQHKGRILKETDAFMLPPGVYTVSSVTYAGMVQNLPEVYPGTLEIVGNPGQALKVARYYPYLRDYAYWTVSANLSNGFMPWQKIGDGGGGGNAGTTVSPYAQHSFRQTQLLTAMEGPVYTGGRGAIAWRIDHGLKNFRDIMLPIFRAAGIVPMITYNPRDWSRSENEGVTAADLNQWVANGWVEISNHAASHTSASGNAAIEDQIVTGLAEIEAELPAARGKVFGFCVAGSGGYTDDEGQTFTNGATPEQWGSHAGRLILEHHAVGYGYLPGTDLRVLDGTPRDGLSHLGTDTRPVSEFTAKIDQAIAQKKGLQIMSHPSNLGNQGYHDGASTQAIVDYIVAKRTAGDLAVLTSYQMMVADSRF